MFQFQSHQTGFGAVMLSSDTDWNRVWCGKSEGSSTVFLRFLSQPLPMFSAQQGEATSEGSKDPADNATNFCSLQNLVNGDWKRVSSDTNLSACVHSCWGIRWWDGGFPLCFRKQADRRRRIQTVQQQVDLSGVWFSRLQLLLRQE